MSETRPSMIKSCRVWLRDRQDIPEEKRICINKLLVKADPAEVIFRRGEKLVCPACGKGITVRAKYCIECGQKLDIKTKPIFTEEVIGEIAERREKGETYIEIAEAMGLKPKSVSSMMYNLNYDKSEHRNYKRYTLEELKAAKERHDNGESWNQIAMSTGRGRGGVYLKRMTEQIFGKSEENDI